MASHVCPWWLAYTFDNPLRILFHKPEIIFAPYVHEGMVVADIGCGMGYFSIGLAKIVKESGKVFAVDIQKKMLEKMTQRAKKQGVWEIIEPIQCTELDIGIAEPLDFAMAFWMAHETPDIKRFFSQIYAVLKPGGHLLISEPKFHVAADEYRDELAIAGQVGFSVKEEPQINFSYSVVLEKPG